LNRVILLLEIEKKRREKTAEIKKKRQSDRSNAQNEKQHQSR